MIDVRFQRGLYLPEADLWLDPWDAKGHAFVSHAHADHFARHERSLCSEITASLIRSRFHMPEDRLEPLRYHLPVERQGHRLRLLPAGHIAGSAMLHVTRLADGATLLYTGDFKVRRGRTADPVVFQQADLLIVETTFGLPHYVFPPPMEVEMQVLRFVNDAFADGEVPVLLGYSLGKAQEALALLHSHDIPALLHPNVAEMTAACRAAGVGGLPEPLPLDGPVPAGHAVIAPPNAVRSKHLRSIPNRRVAMLSGWALTPGAAYRYRVDEAIPLSDHADHPGLLECVQRVRPKKILTVHGHEREFAAELRQRGHDAWSACGHDQLELAISAPAGQRGHLPGIATAASARHSRPICAFADFSDLCRLVGETNSRIEKIRHLAAYLRSLEGDDELALATTWLTGHALPRENGLRALQTGSATIRRALLRLPGAREERYREISLSQNDTARTARLLLQELALRPEPLDLAGAADFFRRLAGAPGAIARIDQLASRLRTLHPAEGETIVKLLTGDLRIGLKEGLVEDAIAAAFGMEASAVRHSHMLTGQAGETAVLARRGRLDEATLRPFVPVKSMLASPTPDAASLVGTMSARPTAPEQDVTDPSPDIWLEPKYDGIRAQLHKQGDHAALYSRDLRPLDAEFPELLEAALRFDRDFILDGEIIAHADGRRLTFKDLQKRLGRRAATEDLFADLSTPVRLIAFDLLFLDGKGLLDRPLSERRQHLDALLFRGQGAPATAAIEAIALTFAADTPGVESAFKLARS